MIQLCWNLLIIVIAFKIVKKLTFIVSILVLLFSQTYAQDTEKRLVSTRVTGMPFKDYVELISKQTDVQIYYNPLWVEGLLVNASLDSVDARMAIEKAFLFRDLTASWWGNAVVVLKSQKLISELDLQASGTNIESSPNSTGKTESEERYLIGRRSDVLKVLVVGKKGMASTKERVKIRGKIADGESGESLIGATMYIEELGVGAATDQNGFLSVVVPTGNYTSRFDCLGQKTERYQFKVLSGGEFSISLAKEVIAIDEVVVYGDKSMNITTREAGLEKLTMRTIKEIPMMMGERDIIKVSELLPGIVSVGEGSAGINVRGGNFDQNGFYINKIPIYNTSHVFGFFPAFNPDIVKDFSIYKGHIPAEYGGRLSSIFDIITRQGNRKKFTVHGGLNPVTSNITIEGPIVKDTASIIVSARSSYSDWILSRISDPDISQSSTRFSDITFSANYDPSMKNQFSFFSYYSKDYFKFSDLNEYDYSNLGASLMWRHTITPSLRTEFSLIASEYSFNTIDKETSITAYEHGYSIQHFESKNSMNYLIGNKSNLSAGLSLIYYNLERGKVNPYKESIKVPVDLGVEKGFEGSVFLSELYDPFNWLSISLGARYSFYTPLGPKDVYSYSANQPKTSSFIADTLHYGNNKPIKWYSGPEIRASLNFKTDLNGSIKISYNQTKQFLFLLNNTISLAPNSQWKLSDYYLKPASSQQLSFGVFRNLFSSKYEASVEFFHKQTKNYTEFKDGASFIDNPNVEAVVLQGDQRAYGIEAMLKKTGGKFNGWIAYTYSRSFVKVDGKYSWDDINSGIEYPSNFDIPHVVNMVANYRFTRRFVLSSTITYQKGRPITFPKSIYYVDGVQVIDYSERNEFRIPDYFRIDMSLNVEGNLKKDKLVHSSWVFGVYNLTGRRNPYSIFFKSEDGKIKGYKYSVIGVPIFTVTWVFKLGNYSSE